MNDRPASAPDAHAPASASELDARRLERPRRRGARRATALLFLTLLAVYALALGLPGTPGSDLRVSEAHVLLTTESITHDGDFELTNQYAGRDWTGFYDGELRPTALRVDGRLIEPQGLGFPALVVPAYAVGGRIAVELLLAMLAAAGFAAAAALGRRLVPDPWASGAALAVGVSPPAVLAATTIAPLMTCATLIAVAALLALRVRDEPTSRGAIAAGVLLALVPWIGPVALLPAAVVMAALFRWLRRRRRAWTGLAALEIPLLSLVVFVTVNGRLFGGLTPYAAATFPDAPTGAGSVGDYLGRLPRLATVWFDPDVGLLLYAPVAGLVFVSLWLLWRSRRDRLAQAFPAEIDVEVTAGFLAAICGAALATAVLLLASFDGRGPGEPLAVALPCAGALAAWGMRRHRTVGIALSLIGLALTIWVLVAARLDDDAGVSPVRGDVPWGLLR